MPFFKRTSPPKRHFFSSLQFALFPVYSGKNLGGVDITGCSARILRTYGCAKIFVRIQISLHTDASVFRGFSTYTCLIY